MNKEYCSILSILLPDVDSLLREKQWSDVNPEHPIAVLEDRGKPNIYRVYIETLNS